MLKGMLDPNARRGAMEQIEIFGKQPPDFTGVLFGLTTIGARYPPLPQVEYPVNAAYETHSDPK